MDEFEEMARWHDEQHELCLSDYPRPDLAAKHKQSAALLRRASRERKALEYCAETGDAGRHDGRYEACPANDHVMMWLRANEALSSEESRDD